MCQRENNPETSTLDYQLYGVKKGNTRKKKNHMEKKGTPKYVIIKPRKISV